METKHFVYVAQSLDGFIADRNEGLDWLYSVPNPDGDDFGFADFLAGIDALVMGRRTFETVCAFDMAWPYPKPVFVLSSTLSSIPDKLSGRAEIVSGTPVEVLAQIHAKGYHKLYIDGGKTIQSFLAANLVDELTVTTLPILLGGGVPLFGELPGHLPFELVESEVLLGQLVRSRYRRVR